MPLGTWTILVGEVHITRSKKLVLREQTRDTISAYLFLLPALITFSLFIGGPIVVTFFLTTTEYNIVSPIKFVGFRNFAAVFRDPEIINVILNTLKFVVILTPLHIVIGLLLAAGVTSKMPGGLRYFHRTAIYLPSIVTTASVAIAWFYIFDIDFGVLNYFIGLFGAQPVPWLMSDKWSIVAIALFSIWKFVGNSFIYFLIGLQGIPSSFFEAAEIDGANWFQIFFRIKLPLLSPTVFFVSTTLLIGCMQMFDEPFLLTGGGPGVSSKTIALYIYQKAFKSYNLGYASTFALLLFALVLLITLFQFSMQRRWVNYDYE